ncbi:prolipoprotein diacylglyceryl transferase [Fontivita pretiosa]|uniref:prolipoprotein diacylglyceryl transferase n=1 Tax=Fontivita pretiosa TaxID=2989684 RepID=UPI003D180582
MQPILFRLPVLNVPIYSYGLMMVIGFLAAIQLAKFLARRSGIDPEIFVNAGLIALIAGVVGARLSHVIENFHQYTDPSRSAWANFVDAINIRSGGLTYYGGFLLAFPILVLYAIKKKVPLKLGMDIVAPCLMIGLGFGRIGCFLNGCCYGDVCDLPWAVTFPNNDLGPVHPAQLYSAFTAFLIAGISYSFFTLRPAPGRVFALMLMLEGVTRFILELLRVEPPVLGPFSLSMLLGVGIALLGVVLWFVFRPGIGSADARPTATAA